MKNRRRSSISITLSPAQVDEVVRAAGTSRAPGISELLVGALAGRVAADEERGAEGASFNGLAAIDAVDPRFSRSLLRGLLLLTCFDPGGEERGIVEIADELGMSPSTTHRYALTLVELGLLERCPDTRKYRLPATRARVR
jgi:IclR helix-turn-helix domain